MKLLEAIKKSFPELEKLFDRESLYEFSNCKYENLWIYHFSIGTRIRNSMLTKDSKLTELFLSEGVKHKDHMSMILIQLFHQSLHKIGQTHNITS